MIGSAGGPGGSLRFVRPATFFFHKVFATIVVNMMADIVMNVDLDHSIVDE